MKLKSFTKKDRHGNMTSFEFFEDPSLEINMTSVPMMEGIPDHPGDPKGTDTVPAWLTPGEYVMNAEATRIFEPQIEQMNNVGRAVQEQQGGSIPEYSAHGGQVGKPTGNYTQYGKPIFRTDEGEYVSEKGRSIPISTMPVGLGKIYNIPSIQDGVMRNEDFLREGIQLGKLNPTGVYDTIDEAIKASKERSKSLEPTEYASGGPVYMNQGGWLDSLLGMFSGNNNEPARTAKEIFDERIPSLQNKANLSGPTTPTRPDPLMSNKVYMDLLKDKEGFRNEAYLDSAGIPTIGYGFTKGVKMGDTMTEEAANARLLEEMAVTDRDYNNLVTADLNPNQEAAVKSLIYNIGGPQFANSKARAALNAGDFEAFQKEAAEFRMADGKVIPGLENRRRDENILFNTPWQPLSQSVGQRVSQGMNPNINWGDNETPQSAPIIRSLNKFGKTDNYQKVGDEWYRIKDNGELAKDPAGPLHAANLNNAEGSPLVGDPVATQEEIVRANEFADAGVPKADAGVPKIENVPPVLEDEDMDQDAEQMAVLEEYAPWMTSPKMQGDNRSMGSQYGPKKNYGDVAYTSLGNPQPVNQNSKYLDPNFLSDLGKRKADGKISDQAYQYQLAQYEKTIKQNNAYQSYLKDKEAGTDSETLMLKEEKALADTQRKISLRNQRENETDPVVLAAIDKELIELGDYQEREDEDFDQDAEQQKVIDSGLQLAGTEDEDLDQAAQAEEALLGMVDPMGDNDFTPRYAVTTGEDPEDMDEENLGVPSLNEPPKPNLAGSGTSTTEAIDSAIAAVDGEEEAVNIANEIIADDDNLPDDGTTKGQTADSALQAGQNANADDVGKVEGMMQTIFGDLFDKGELHRMAIMYVGSRLMGGSHNGSMNFAAKQYVERVDAKHAAAKELEREIAKEERAEDRLKRREERALKREIDKEARVLKASLKQQKLDHIKTLNKEQRKQYQTAYVKHEANVTRIAESGNYSPEVIQAYNDSWDPKTQKADSSLLIKKDVLPEVTQNDLFQTYYQKDPTTGKLSAIQAAEYTIVDGNTTKKVLLDRTGKPINSAKWNTDKSQIPGTDEFDDFVIKDSKNYSDVIENWMERYEDEDNPNLKLDASSDQLAIQVAEWRRRNNVGALKANEFLNSGLAAMLKEKQDRLNNDDDREVKNIKKYLDGAYITATVGNANLFTQNGESVGYDVVKDFTDNILSTAKQNDVKRIANGQVPIIGKGVNDRQALDKILSGLSTSFAIGQTYQVPDPDSSNPNDKKTITIDKKMMEVWEKEAKKQGISPFMAYVNDRLKFD